MVAPGRGRPGSVEQSRSMSLIELGLRGPTLGVLQRQGILSVAQLIRMTPAQLMGMRRVGLSRMMEIRQALRSHGLDLTSEGSSYPARVWQFSRRVRLTCCDVGECTLDLRTASASPGELARAVDGFVAAHRECPRLGGRQPVFTTVETTRPGTTTFLTPEVREDSEEVEEAGKAQTA